ncbi:MAG TPA: hypothetical protein V6D08_08985 [Candidatus Obscuribacterales bacterium]
MSEIERYLHRQDRGALISLIVDHAQRDAAFCRELEALACGRRGSQQQSACDILQQLTAQVQEYVKNKDDKADSRAELEHLERHLVKAIEHMINFDTAADIRSFIEYVFKEVEAKHDALLIYKFCQQPIANFRRRLLELHLRACQLAPPVPRRLAETLFDWVFYVEADCFVDAPKRYSNLLKEEGLLQLQVLLEEHWHDIMAKGGRVYRAEYTALQKRILSMMEHTAALTKRFDLLHEIHAGKKQDVLDIIHLCQFYERIGQLSTAIRLAEEYLHMYPADESLLGSFLVKHYPHVGRVEEGLALLKRIFANSSVLPFTFERVKEYCLTWLPDRWPSCRQECIAIAREARERKPLCQSVYGTNTKPNTSLLEIYISEQEYDLAWQEVEAGFTTSELSLELAKLSWRRFPDTATARIEAEMRQCIERKGEKNYRAACEHLALLEEIYRNTGRTEVFSELVRDIRRANGLKTLLLSMMDHNGWGD